MLRDGSAAAAAEIRRIRAAYPETQMRPVSAVEGDFREMQVVRAPNEPGHEVLTWLKRAAYHLTDRAVHPTGMVAAGDAHWWHVSTFRRAVVTDMSEQGLRVRTRDRALALALARRGARSLARLATEGPKVAAQYRAEMGRPDEPGELGAALRPGRADRSHTRNRSRTQVVSCVRARRPWCERPAADQLSKICFQPSRLVRCGAASR